MARIGDGDVARADQEAAQLLAPLRLGREPDVAPTIDPFRRALVIQPHVLRRGFELDFADLAFQVGLVEAADQILFVAQAAGLGRAGGEQQARRLQGAGGDHDGLGGDCDRLSGNGLGQNAGDRRPGLAGGDLDGDGVDQHRHGLAGRDLFAIGAAEMGRFAEPLDAVEDHVLAAQPLDQRGLGAGKAVFGPKQAGPGAADLERAGIVGGHLVIADGPARMGNPRALFEVDRIERDAAPAPDRGGAAELAPPVHVHRPVVVRRDRRGAIELLGGLVEAVAAGLQHDAGDPHAVEFQRQGQACGAGADDGDVGLMRSRSAGLARV